MDQGGRILKKLESHDLEFARIGKKLEEHDRRFDAHDLKFDSIDRRFDENAKRFDGLLNLVLEHNKKIETLATKDEVKLLRQEMLSHHDQVMVILLRLDQERVFANARFERLEQKTGLT
ncbi:hypothetical protein EPO33_03090 [Patescibacteria group bacterium]|nr:MAG: hypothetical protein EPO33_03090 [Patescibacteria group bacterium]